MKKTNKFLHSILLLLALCQFQAIMAQTFVHPSIPFTINDLNQLKANITREPWLSAYNAFKNDSRSKLSYVMQGPFVEVGRAPNLNMGQWDQDMIAIHNLAWMWIFTNDSAYARKATDMLEAWAVTNKVWSGTENDLEQGDYARYYVVGADILRGTFPGWTVTNTTHVKSYFLNLYWPTTFVPSPLRDHNKGALQLETALSVAAFLDDKTKWDQAIEVYRIDAGGGMRNSLPNGEVGDAGRDDHWFTQADGLAWATEVAWKQGVDLFAELNNRMLSVGELYNKFNIDTTGMRFTPFGGYSAYYTNWGITGGMRHQNPFNNIIEGAYSLRKGIPTPYTSQMRTLAGEGTTSFLYLKSSDTSTATALPPLVYPTTEVAGYLTNTDIGNTGISGNASYSGGAWIVNGSGNSVANVVNFTFKPINGDVAIIAKVTGNSIRSANSGLMIRESLSAGSNYVSINLNGAGGVTSSSQGSTANDNGSHFQPKTPWWLKLERIGNRIFTYHSADSINWTNNSLFIMTLPASAYIGLYTISNNTSALNTATFSNVAITNSTPAGSPVISSPTMCTATVSTAFNYVITATNSPVTYSATGMPAGLSIDSSSGIISGTPMALGTFAITLAATNANGVGTAVIILKVSNNVTPAAPGGSTATVVNTSNIKLTWTAVANASGYAVKRSLIPGGPYTTIATGVTSATYTDASPVPEINNYYVVTAFAGTLESGVSNEVFKSVPPSIPGKPVVFIQSSELDLSWQAALGAASYHVKRGSSMGGPYTTIATISTTSYSDLAVTSGSPYYYVVSSIGNTQESGNSPETFGVPGASSVTWNPTPDSESWNQSSNWIENYIPTNPAIITFKATNDSVMTNDITGLQVSRILFDTTATAYTISGNSVAFGNDLVNNSLNAQTLSIPMVLNNQLNINTNTQDITLSGLISGPGSLLKTGASILYMSGANTYSGNTTIGGAAGGWPPGNAIAIAGIGTGTSGSPTSGPLGTGKIIMNGGALFSAGSDATLYNDIEIAAGKSSYFFQTTNAINLRGRLTGSGTIRQDGNTFAGMHLFGDNSGFTGSFICVLRSGNNRLRFEVPEAGSANANWNLDATGIDCQSLQFATGTINFGALTGRGYFRNNGGGAPVMSIGALNLSTNFGGTINGTIGIEKVGTANLNFTGNHTYTSATIIRNGKFLLNNNASTGSFASPVTAVAGSFGGAGLSSAAIIIGTGSGTGATLEPGNLAIGTLTTTNALTMNSDATFALEVNSTAGISDMVKANSVTLNNPILSVQDLVPGSFSLGDSLMIVNNTGSAAVIGTFKNLPELSLVTISGFNFRITYKGGTGNDIVLRDDRTIPKTITSPNTAKGLIGNLFNYPITATGSSSSFDATGLPAGLGIDNTTGLISGIPTATGTFTVNISATDSLVTTTTPIIISIFNNQAVTGLFVANGDAKNVIDWDATAAADTFYIKRSGTSGGPYVLIGKSLMNRYIDATLTNGSVYYYIISSITGTIESPNSLEVAAIPKLGQFAYYNFDETSGPKVYDYWGGNHATLMAGAVRNLGKFNQGLQFTGGAVATSTSYASLPAGVVSTLSNFTIALWVNMASFTTWARIFDFGNTGTTKTMYLCPKTSTTGKLRFGIKNGGTEQDLDASYTFVANTWTHVAITDTANVVKLYVNGNLVGTSTTITIKPSDLGITANNYFGKANSGDPMLTGSLDEFRIYNRALSSAEIANLLQADQVITFPPFSQKEVGDTDFTLPARVSSGLPVTYTSSDSTIASIVLGKVHLLAAGTASITASQPGNTSYRPAIAVTQLLTVVKKEQTINFAEIAPKTIGDSSFDPGATASSGLPVIYTSSNDSVATIVNGKVTLLAAGTAVITAVQSGDNTYNNVSFARSVIVDKKAQSITFNAITAKRAGDPDFAVVAVATSGLSVSFISSNENVAIITNGMVHILGAGSTILTASQAGNDLYQSATFNQTLIVLPFNLKVQHLDGDNGQVSNNTIKPYLKIVNDDSVAVAYSELTARYWLTPENFTGINTWIDYAQLGSNVKMKYVALAVPRNGALGYVEYSFQPAAGNLTAGSNSGVIQSRLANSDWSNLDETDDYSHVKNQAYTANARITLYRNGQLIWGVEPLHSAQVMSLKAYTETVNSGQNTISTYLKVNNEGNLPVAYGDISVRYWFTSEGPTSLNYWVDYAKLGSSNMNGQFVRLIPALNNADVYFEIKVNAGLGVFYPLSTSGNIQYRIAKSDWSNFVQANDYSYLPMTSFNENNHLTVYYKGQLIYGTEPSGSVNLMGAANNMVESEQTEGDVSAIILYPNPAVNTLSISIGNIAKEAVAQIFTANGVLIYTQSLVNKVSTLSVQRWTPGVYYVKIKNGNTITIKKVVKE